MIITIIIVSLALIGLIWYVTHADAARRKHRENVMARPFPEEWKNTIEANIPLYKKLPEDLKNDLHRKILVFLDEKSFEGCGGFEITDDAKVIVAAQACILILNRPNAFYRKLRNILIYPDIYMAKHSSDFGIRTASQDIPVAGQSYDSGTVILAWRHVTHGARNIKDGKNVVFHEFAHQLDQDDGSTDGMPIMRDRSQFTPWITNVGKEFDKFTRRIARGRTDVMDSYGATNTAEFFAVATETFFEKPYQLYRKHSSLFKEMQDYFMVDPREWV